MSYQAIIFDLDGTLIDSERIWFDEFKKMCATFGKEYRGEHHALMMGRARAENNRTFREVLGVPVTDEMLTEVRRIVHRRLFEGGEMQLKSGVKTFIELLVQKGLPLGVATSSPATYREPALAQMGILQYFSGFASAEDVKQSKPAPDIFLAVAKSLSVDPTHCLAVEDGLAGIKSGVAAGMDVLGIRDTMFFRELPGAKKVIDSFDEITVSQIEAMSEK